MFTISNKLSHLSWKSKVAKLKLSKFKFCQVVNPELNIAEKILQKIKLKDFHKHDGYHQLKFDVPWQKVKLIIS